MDQIANMVNMIKNAGRAEHEFVVVPYSKIKHAIGECLVKEGFLSSVTKKTKKGFPTLELGVVYKDGKPKDTRTNAQKHAMFDLIVRLTEKYKGAKVLGHRDFPNVAKACPSFDVKTWLAEYTPDLS